MSAGRPSAPARGGRGRQLVAGLLVGVLAVALALVTGGALAGLLGALGLTETGATVLGPWLAGLGLLGGWQQEVTADVAGGMAWSTWAAGAPLLVTWAAALGVSAAARRGWLAGVGLPGAILGAGCAAAALVVASAQVTTVTNGAGSVRTVEGLTWWWTGGLRPGTVTGAALLVAAVGLAHTWARPWWDSGRTVARGLLLWPGLVITAAVAAGAVWLTSTPSVGVALAALYPLLGTAVLLALGGAPVEAGLTRISPEPYALTTWSAGPLVAVGGIALAMVVAVAVGVVLRLRRRGGAVLPGVTATATLALGLTWAMATTVEVPGALGGMTRLATQPLLAALVAGAMAGVALLVRGRARSTAVADPLVAVPAPLVDHPTSHAPSGGGQE